MKRIGKILASAVLAVALCLSLCSCAALDELKASRAEWHGTENGEKVIVFQNSVYRSTSSLLIGRELHTLFSSTAYLAEPDVPALLLPTFGTTCACSSDASVMNYCGTYYVREDRYEDLRALLNDNAPHRYCVEDRDEDYTLFYSLIPTGQTDLLDALTALADASADTLPDDPYGEDLSFSRSLSRCDEKLSFLVSSYCFVRFSAQRAASSPSETLYFYNMDTDRAAEVPAEHLAAVERMIDSMNMFDDLWW